MNDNKTPKGYDPFDMKRFKSGEPAYDKDGHIYTYSHSTLAGSVVGRNGYGLYELTDSGALINHPSIELYMRVPLNDTSSSIPEDKIRLWINLYRNNGFDIQSKFFETEEAANSNIFKYLNHINTIPVLLDKYTIVKKYFAIKINRNGISNQCFKLHDSIEALKSSVSFDDNLTIATTKVKTLINYSDL